MRVAVLSAAKKSCPMPQRFFAALRIAGNSFLLQLFPSIATASTRDTKVDRIAEIEILSPLPYPVGSHLIADSRGQTATFACDPIKEERASCSLYGDFYYS
jgi:hypothetical protein